MAGTNTRERRYYRCLDAIRQVVTLLNEDIRLRAEHRGPDLDRARAHVRKLEQQDANLRCAVRTAGL